MQYWEACDTEVTKAEARQEVKRHNADWNEFVAEMGDKEEYQGKEVLDWLGY